MAAGSVAEKDNIYLTITQAYAPSWGTWEGVREFVQNWYDGVLDSYEGISPPRGTERRLLKIESSGENEFKASLTQDKATVPLGTLAYERDKKRLTLINHNTELPAKVLLLGYSSKKGHQDIIGQFGEGLKIGTLALLRAAHKVLVATKSRTWRFAIKEHPQFNESVLAVSIEENSQQEFASSLPFGNGDTISQIWPIEEDDWTTWIKRFLFLCPPKEYCKTEIGTLLFDDHLLRQLYVKKIWVEDRTKKEDLHVGVNFKELQIDRDRRAVVFQSEIDHSVAVMWSRALKTRPELASKYFQLLEKSDHMSDVRLANMYLEDKSVVRLLADEFFKLYGENAIPVPNSSAADRLSYLHKELQEKVVLCNQNLIDILKRSGKVRMVEDVLNQQRPDTNVGKRLFKDIPEDQLQVLTEAEQFVKMINPNFTSGDVEFHEGREQVVTFYGDNQFEIPQWMLSPEYIHQTIACPAESPDHCYCAPAFLCERILSAMGQRRNDPGDRKIQEFVLTLAVLAKGKRPKRKPELSSVSDVLKKNEEELHKKIEILTTCLREQQKKHEADLEVLRQDLAKFQSDLANEDVRFVERENDLIERQKMERDEMTKAYQEQLKFHEQEKKNLEEDYNHKSGQLEAEKRKKMELEKERDRDRERHRNEMTLKNEETLTHRKRLAGFVDQFSMIQSTAKKASLSKKGDLYKEIERFTSKSEAEYKSENCMICTTTKRDCSLVPCKHIFCLLCVEGLKQCPVCQRNINDRSILK